MTPSPGLGQDTHHRVVRLLGHAIPRTASTSGLGCTTIAALLTMADCSIVSCPSMRSSSAMRASKGSTPISPASNEASLAANSFTWITAGSVGHSRGLKIPCPVLVCKVVAELLALPSCCLGYTCRQNLMRHDDNRAGSGGSGPKHPYTVSSSNERRKSCLFDKDANRLSLQFILWPARAAINLHDTQPVLSVLAARMKDRASHTSHWRKKIPLIYYVYM